MLKLQTMKQMSRKSIIIEFNQVHQSQLLSYFIKHMFKFTNKIARYFTSQQILPFLQLKKDKYNAIHINLKQEVEGKLFDQYISNLLKQNSENGTTSVWVHLNGPQLSLASNLVNLHSFNFHRGVDKSIYLYKWILKTRNDMVVPYSMFHVGCGGALIHNNSILLIQQKRGELKGRYGIPGGRADFGQGLQQCSQRQVFQQIGVKSKFQRILWLRELSSYVYGSYDFYFGCLMSATPQEISNLKVCDYEIQKAIWMPLKDYRAFAKENSFGTQLQFANYIADLYEKGYDFSNKESNYAFKRYSSPIDKKERFFGHHKFV